MKLVVNLLSPNSEKIVGFYKGNNFINDIVFWTFLFVFCDLKLNTMQMLNMKTYTKILKKIACIGQRLMYPIMGKK